MTIHDRIADVLAHPLGRDILEKLFLQMGLSRWILENPLFLKIRLNWLPRLTRGYLDRPFLDTLVELLNSESDVPGECAGPDHLPWWRSAVFYQIYPKSFKDSNGDGIGDLPGILEKLDYLQALGVDAIWLSPIYDSPEADNGYDIRDYSRIQAAYGTMADFEALLRAVHGRGMKLIMDLVVNHTSDEHRWFQEALKDKNSPFGDYYFFQDEPNNWTSYFGGSAWKYFPERDQWALHLFDEKQMDLNWDHPPLREEIVRIVHEWLDRGVDGFRLDVINYISKREGLPEGNKTIHQLVGFAGIEHYFYGPNLHRYLRELRELAFTPYEAFTVGETPGIGRQSAKLLTSPRRRELDLIFSFDHLENPGKIRYDDYRYDLNHLKTYMIDWMEDGPDWMALFLENHDNTRMISKVNPDPALRSPLARLLAVIQLTLKGTPFLFQGQELGLINNAFTGMDQLRDVESLNLFAALRKKIGDEAAFEKILTGSRDHSRTPMPWTSGPAAGFTTGEPWIPMDEDHRRWNAADQHLDPDSVLRFYQAMIRLRRSHPSLSLGSIEIQYKTTRDLFYYQRSHEQDRLIIECNLSARRLRRPKPSEELTRLLSNYPDVPAEWLRPYEAIVWMPSADLPAPADPATP